ncbi:MAG: AraC family transcriptional regulator [Nevskia sp.]|nr:AraC family transcriptional regulator [Nevskia sp.]
MKNAAAPDQILHGDAGGAAYTLLVYVPPAPLSDFVDRFWYCEHPNPAHRYERVMPSGRMALVVNLVEDRLSCRFGDRPPQYSRGICIAGAYLQHAVLDTAEQRRIMGVHFKPGGMFPFLAPPAEAFTDTDVSLEDLWGARAHSLHQQLIDTPTPQAKFAILERALLSYAARPLKLHPAVAHALRELERVPAMRTISELARETRISPKRFIRLFREQVGYTPKYYCRVRRFQRVLRMIERSRTVEWAGIAVDCGYYDQAHFIRDFRAFSGWNPSAYLTVRGERVQHIPLPG